MSFRTEITEGMRASPPEISRQFPQCNASVQSVKGLGMIWVGVNSANRNKDVNAKCHQFKVRFKIALQSIFM